MTKKEGSASLAVTTEGLPLGLAAVKFWTRKKFKGTNALRGKVNATRIPIEEKESYRWVENLRQATDLLESPDRCVHVGDLESDIFELFCAAQDARTSFVVRTCVDRLAEDGDTTIAQEMNGAKRGTESGHAFCGTSDHGNRGTLAVQVRLLGDQSPKPPGMCRFGAESLRPTLSRSRTATVIPRRFDSTSGIVRCSCARPLANSASIPR